MERIVKILISAVVNGLIAYIGAILTLLTSLDTTGPVDWAAHEVPRYVALGTGLLTALKDAQAAMKNF